MVYDASHNHLNSIACMNLIFFALILIAFATSAWREVTGIPMEGEASPMEALSTAMVDAAGGAVELAIGLVGVITLFLGLMKVAEAGGLLRILARFIQPFMVRLFPDIPPDHPAMGAMILNLSANLLGLGNAATPFGIRAMQALEQLNPAPGTATPAMILFLAINTSSVTLLPTDVMALRAAAGSTNPAGIVPTTLVATLFSTAIAIGVSKICQQWGIRSRDQENSEDPPDPQHLSQPEDLTPASAHDLTQVAQANQTETVEQILPDPAGDHDRNESETQNDIPSDHDPPPTSLDPSYHHYPIWVSYLALACLLVLIPIMILFGKQISPWILPGLILGFLSFGIARRVKVYEAFVDGAREGFQVAMMIIPFLVAILVAIGMLRASGALEGIVSVLGVVTEPLGLPGEALPMALLRPLSGSGAFGVMASIINDPAIGPDSYTGYLVSTIMGSTETTFYVLAVYFGAVQIRRIRYMLIPALSADLAGIVGAVLICSLLYRGRG